MAMEHSCHGCGLALGRVRAPADPVYGLPVVVCPGCGSACVRRRHPLVAMWRGARAAAGTAVGLAWRLLLCAMFVGMSIGMCAMLSHSLNSMGPVRAARFVGSAAMDDRWIEAWKGDDGPLIAGMFVAWSIALGAALTAGFGHVRRRWVVWAMFLVAMAGVLVLDQIGAYVWMKAHAVEEYPFRRMQIGPLSPWALVSMAIGVAGAPIGRLIRRGFAKGDARRWGAARRRVKKRRLAA